MDKWFYQPENMALRYLPEPQIYLIAVGKQAFGDVQHELPPIKPVCTFDFCRQLDKLRLFLVAFNIIHVCNILGMLY